ncbi:uncharacterized protein LOC106157379 [Lingula anatina]|uniref:Uncharacterized protein LOC106157379 n=1 Tax=Lingula anatina TaxID=7574 RepID=A0A1S3HQZ9_LINAN|nr:uncharacterized protein LOC106157379 [Lingula anatina]|eukprot:XP_013388462.1 uncharacterized protein LOC106157379 [Lingula anatina]
MMNTLIVIISCIYMARALPHPEKTMRVEKTKRDAGAIGLHHYNVHAHEMGTLVEEKVDVDEERGLVSYSIPQHNDIDESVFVYDFKNNLTLMIFAQAGKCYVAPLDDRESQDPKTTVAAFQSTGEQEKAVSGIETDSYVIDGGEVEADAVLPPDLVERCSGMSMSRVKPMLETFSFDSDGK